MSENPRCPKCSSLCLAVERRPDGNARCQTCSWFGPYKECFLKQKSEQAPREFSIYDSQGDGLRAIPKGCDIHPIHETIDVIEKSAFDALKKEFEAEQAEIAKIREENDNLKAGISYMGRSQLMAEFLKVKTQVAGLRRSVGKYYEYFKAIENGEYNESGTPRPAPLRQFEAMLQAIAEEALADCAKLEGK